VVCDAVSRLRDEGFSARATITMTLDELSMPGATLDRILLEDARDDGRVELGHRSYQELPALYRSHDVFIFPSVSETFGHPMAEALSTGLPIVAADTPINREVCGDAALYFRPFMASDLCARIKQLDENPELRARLRESALERAKNLYQWDDHVTRLLETFEAVLSRRS
jgi:glycosyltransferase involved in cell wall biosynthesis